MGVAYDLMRILRVRIRLPLLGPLLDTDSCSRSSKIIWWAISGRARSSTNALMAYVSCSSTMVQGRPVSSSRSSSCSAAAGEGPRDGRASASFWH